MVAFFSDPEASRRRRMHPLLQRQPPDEGEKSILLHVCRYTGKHRPDLKYNDPDLGHQVNEWWIIKPTADGPKIFKLLKFPAPDPDLCLHESNCAISNSSLYILGGADKYRHYPNFNKITSLETLNPSAGWKSIDFKFPFCYSTAIVESIGNWIFMFPDLSPFMPTEQNYDGGNQNPNGVVYDTNLWGYAFDTIEKKGFPIPPPTPKLFWSSLQCCGFLNDKQIVASVSSDVFVYNTVDKSWKKLQEAFSNVKDSLSLSTKKEKYFSSAHSNGVLYMFDGSGGGLRSNWLLHCYDTRTSRKFVIDLGRLHFEADFESDHVSMVPVGDDSTLCFLWHKKTARIGRCHLYYAKIKLCFRDVKCSPNVTVLEKMNFDYVDFDHITNCLPFDCSMVDDKDFEEVSFSNYSEIKELKMKQMEKLIDEEMELECPIRQDMYWRGRIPNMHLGHHWMDTRRRLEYVEEKIFSERKSDWYNTEEEEDDDSPPSSAPNYRQPATPFLSSGSIFSEYKGYLARGCRLLRKFIKK